MHDHLRIEGDPTTWVLSEPVAEPATLTGSGEPFRIPVAAPLSGTLLLSRRAAASAVLYSPADVGGAIPSGARLVTAVLYLPSVTGAASPAAAAPPWYPLPPSADLAALETEIMGAMSQGTFSTVEFSSVASSGVLVLNGATLPFVVLCPAAPRR